MGNEIAFPTSNQENQTEALVDVPDNEHLSRTLENTKIQINVLENNVKTSQTCKKYYETLAMEQLAKIKDIKQRQLNADMALANMAAKCKHYSELIELGDNCTIHDEDPAAADVLLLPKLEELTQKVAENENLINETFSVLFQ